MVLIYGEEEIEHEPDSHPINFQYNNPATLPIKIPTVSRTTRILNFISLLFIN